MNIYRDTEEAQHIKWLDRDDAALLRWFENWRCDPEATYTSYDFLLINDEPWRDARGNLRTRYVGRIREDAQFRYARDDKLVLFEIGAPAPPSFFRPAPAKREPPRKPPYLGPRLYPTTKMLEAVYEPMNEQQIQALKNLLSKAPLDFLPVVTDWGPRVGDPRDVRPRPTITRVTTYEDKVTIGPRAGYFDERPNCRCEIVMTPTRRNQK